MESGGGKGGVIGRQISTEDSSPEHAYPPPHKKRRLSSASSSQVMLLPVCLYIQTLSHRERQNLKETRILPPAAVAVVT